MRLPALLLLALLVVPLASAHDLSSGWSSYLLGDGRLSAGTHAGPSGSSPTIAWNKTVQVGSHASPVVVGGLVHFGFQDMAQQPSQGRHVAWDLKNGAQRWTARLNNSIGATPAVAGSTVYGVGIDAKASLYALDAQAGTVKWRHRLDSGGESSPLVQGDTVYVADQSGKVHALKAADGAVRWAAGDKAVPNQNSVSAWGGSLFLSTYSGPAPPAPQACPRPTCTNDYVYALDQATGAIRWKTDPTDQTSADDDFITTPVVIDGRVYASARSVAEYYNDPKNESDFRPAIPGRLFALDATTGALLWKKELPSTNWLAPSVVGGRLIVADTGGTLHVFDAKTGNPSCAGCWSRKVDDNIRAPPAVAGDRVYVGTITYEPCTVGGQTYSGPTRGYLRALSLETGSEAWKVDLGARMPTTAPAVSQGYAVVGARKHIECLAQNAFDVVAVGSDSGAHAANAAPTLNGFVPATGTGAIAPGGSLTWNGSDTNAGDALRYDVHFGRTDPPPLVARLQAANRYAPTLTTGETYHWQIVAYDSHGARTAGPVLSFLTAGTKVTTSPTPTTTTTPPPPGVEPPTTPRGGFLPGLDLVAFVAAVSLALTWRRR